MPFSIKPSTTFWLTLVLAAGRQALAVNDWSVPCTQGACSWDLPVDSVASGSVKIVSLCFTYIPSTSLFRTLSLTPHTYAYVVGTRQCNFGHYPCHRLEYYHELRPEFHNAKNPARVQRQQSRLRPPLSGKRRSEYHCSVTRRRMFLFVSIFH